ncbi:MAG: tol-pal system protein YbgF [Pseudomonadota bacterium]|nr:tol-pal system protein YbgF [Pseudomonadota bacterium]
MRRLAPSRAVVGALLLALAGVLAPPARAGIFDDDEARRAILDLRKQLEQSNDQARARQAEQMTAMSSQLDQLKSSLLDLNARIDQQHDDNAKLRGQIEQLTRDVAELQRKQTDIVQGVDDRLRKVEPQKVTIDDREFSVDPEEKRQYDDALAGFRKGDFDHASQSFGGLLKRFPSSGYRDSALFWMGNAQYGSRAYKDAIASFRSLVATSPDSPHAAEALLAIANCQAELKDTKAARRTIDELVRSYPKSEAAQAGKERLASLK